MADLLLAIVTTAPCRWRPLLVPKISPLRRPDLDPRQPSSPVTNEHDNPDGKVVGIYNSISVLPQPMPLVARVCEGALTNPTRKYTEFSMGFEFAERKWWMWAFEKQETTMSEERASLTLVSHVWRQRVRMHCAWQRVKTTGGGGLRPQQRHFSTTTAVLIISHAVISDKTVSTRNSCFNQGALNIFLHLVKLSTRFLTRKNYDVVDKKITGLDSSTNQISWTGPYCTCKRTCQP